MFQMCLQGRNINSILDKKLIALALLAILVTHSAIASQVMGLASFKKSSKTAKDTSVVNKHITKALEYAYRTKKIEYVKAHIDSAEAVCIEDNIEFPTLLHLARAEYFYLTSDYRNASQEGTIVMNKAKGNNEKEIIARTLNFFGRYSIRIGFYFESIDYFNSSIEISKKNRLRGLIPWNYLGLADIYSRIGDIKENQIALRNMIESSALENDTSFLQIGLFSLGSLYTGKMPDYDKADSLLKKCLEIALIKKDSTFITRSLANLGWNNYLAKKYDIAIAYYNKSLIYSLPDKNYANAANCYGNLGTIYRDMGENEKSLNNYLKAIEQAKLGEEVRELEWVYADMSEMYLRKRDTSNAYKSYVLFKKYSDELLIGKSKQGLNEAMVRYEADTHNKEVELLSLRLRNQRLLIYGSTGLFILCLAVFILMLSRARINAKRRISEMNRKVAEVTQANLRQQMNPHFIFNTLNSIQYYMYQHDKLATNNYLTKFSSLMRKVLENSQHTSVPLRDELDALKLYLELEIIRFKDKFSYEIIVDEELDTLLYKVPTMLIQPYVENSICHGLIPAENKGYIKIDLTLKDDYISCTIEDNGIGRDAAMEKKKKSENNHSSLGTQIVSSRLDLVNALYGTSLKTIYTDLKNNSGESEGTRVEIQIPILS